MRLEVEARSKNACISRVAQKRAFSLSDTIHVIISLSWPMRLRTRFANVPHNVVVSLSVVLVRVLVLSKASLQTRSLQTRVGNARLPYPYYPCPPPLEKCA